MASPDVLAWIRDNPSPDIWIENGWDELDWAYTEMSVDDFWFQGLSPRPLLFDVPVLLSFLFLTGCQAIEFLARGDVKGILGDAAAETRRQLESGNGTRDAVIAGGGVVILGIIKLLWSRVTRAKRDLHGRIDKTSTT